MSWKRLLKSWGSFCGLIQFCWLQCNNYHSVKLISPFYFTNFSWHSLESPESNQKYFTPISSSRHTEFAVAFPCKFDPVWSGLIQFQYHPLNNWILIDVLLCSAALIWLSKLYLLTKSYILFPQSRSSDFWHLLRFHQPLNLHHDIISFHANLLICVALFTYYYGSYFTNNLALISSTYTFITFLIMQF